MAGCAGRRGARISNTQIPEKRHEIFIARTICRRAVSIIWPELHCKREFVCRGLILLKRDAARR